MSSSSSSDTMGPGFSNAKGKYYLDCRPPGRPDKVFVFDRSKTNADNSAWRRAHMTQFMRYMLPADDELMEEIRLEAQEMVCKVLRSRRWPKITPPRFEYEVDNLFWDYYLQDKLGKKFTPGTKPLWPWAANRLKPDFATHGISTKYDSWLKARVAEEEAQAAVSKDKETEASPATEETDGKGITEVEASPPLTKEAKGKGRAEQALTLEQKLASLFDWMGARDRWDYF